MLPPLIIQINPESESGVNIQVDKTMGDDGKYFYTIAINGDDLIPRYNILSEALDVAYEELKHLVSNSETTVKIFKNY